MTAASRDLVESAVAGRLDQREGAVEWPLSADKVLWRRARADLTRRFGCGSSTKNSHDVQTDYDRHEHAHHPQQPRPRLPRRGRVEEAITIFQELIADCERILGSTHPTTFTTRDSLPAPTGRPDGTRTLRRS